MIETIYVVLVVITIIQIIRLWTLLKPITKKSHFTEMRKGTERMVWDLTFKVYKSLGVREEIRVEYDHMKSRIDSMETQLESAEGDVKAKLEDDKVIAEREKDRLEKQIQAIDLTINGSVPTEQYKDGVLGVTEKIEEYENLVGVIDDYIKTL